MRLDSLASQLPQVVGAELLMDYAILVASLQLLEATALPFEVSWKMKSGFKSSDDVAIFSLRDLNWMEVVAIHGK